LFVLQEDSKGRELLMVLIERLSQEQEIAWMDTIIAELINTGEPG
jgi:hypothetical protein